MSKVTNKTNLSLTFEKAFHYIKETYYQDRDVTDFLLVSEGHRNKTYVSFNGNYAVKLHSRIVLVFLNANEKHSIVLVSDVYKSKQTATTIGFYNIKNNKLTFYISPEIKYKLTQYCGDMMGFTDSNGKNVFFRDRRDDNFYFSLKNGFNKKYNKEEKAQLANYLIKENVAISTIISDKYDNLPNIEPVTLYKVRQKQLDNVIAITNQTPEYFEQIRRIKSINPSLFLSVASNSNKTINGNKVNISEPRFRSHLNVISHYIEPIKMHKIKLYDDCDTYLDEQNKIYHCGDDLDKLDGTVIFYDLVKAQEYRRLAENKHIAKYGREKQKFETLPNAIINSFNAQLKEEEASTKNEIIELESQINELKARLQDVQKMREETKILSTVVEYPAYPIVSEYEKEIEVI